MAERDRTFDVLRKGDSPFNICISVWDGQRKSEGSIRVPSLPFHGLHYVRTERACDILFGHLTTDWKNIYIIIYAKGVDSKLTTPLKNIWYIKFNWNLYCVFWLCTLYMKLGARVGYRIAICLILSELFINS